MIKGTYAFVDGIGKGENMIAIMAKVVKETLLYSSKGFFLLSTKEHWMIPWQALLFKQSMIERTQMEGLQNISKGLGGIEVGIVPVTT